MSGDREKGRSDKQTDFGYYYIDCYPKILKFHEFLGEEHELFPLSHPL
jgi:hypothetical protein